MAYTSANTVNIIYSLTTSKSQVSNTCFSSSAVPWTGTEGFPLISPRVIASYSCKKTIFFHFILLGMFSKVRDKHDSRKGHWMNHDKLNKLTREIWPNTKNTQKGKKFESVVPDCIWLWQAFTINAVYRVTNRNEIIRKLRYTAQCKVSGTKLITE